MTVPVDIAVAREAETWKIRYGAVELECATQVEALAEAIALAHAFGKEGEFSIVRAGVMTSTYGPDGFIRAVPSPKRPEPKPNSPMETKEPSRGSVTERIFPQQSPPTRLEERGRVQRIASAFEVTRKGRAKTRK
jgi:hypothetical protein